MKPDGTLRVVFWGTYDLGKPRVRLLLEGARRVGVEVVECHSDPWKGIEDKSRISGFGPWIKRILSLLFCYPSLVWRYIRLQPHDAVLVSYPGHLDILVLRLLARLRGVPVIWDVFVSLYDTVVDDRKIVSRSSPLAWFLYSLEWASCRAADKIFLDTEAHARYFESLHRLPAGHVGRVFVGAETEAFSASAGKKERSGEAIPFTVLFYGQFIPLHGIDTIVRAARRTLNSGEGLRWVLVGEGQETRRIDALIRELDIGNIVRVPWVPYEELIKWILDADVCLGIFGTTSKALRVIPNKVYQILSARRSLITADTPAIRELLVESENIKLVPAGDPEKLAETILRMKRESSGFSHEGHHDIPNLRAIGSLEVGNQLLEIILNSLSVRK